MKQSLLVEFLYNKNYWKKVTTYLFYFFVFAFPFQTRIIYFTNKSYYNKFHIFYHSLFIYFSDILILLIIFLWLLGILLGLFHVKQNYKTQAILGIFIIISLVLSFVSPETNKLIQYFALFKIFLIFLLFCFILNFFVKQMFHKVIWLILANSLLQIFIASYQFFRQESIGLKILGEEYLKNYLPGIAAFYSNFGQRWLFDKLFNVYRETLVIRPYGTFTHSNIYGGFLFVSVIFSYYLFLVSRETWKRFLMGFIIFLEIFGLFISFSRIALLAWILGSIVFFLLLFIMKQKDQKLTIGQQMLKSQNSRQGNLKVEKILILIIAGSTIICSILFYEQILERGWIVSRGTTNKVSLDERALYQRIAWEMIKKNPVTGVGYQNFILRMDTYTSLTLKAYQHQPVHNMYLLIAAEVGIFGSLVFLLFTGSVIWQALRSPWNILKSSLFSIFLGFLFIGLFDHYLLTIQQGRLMFFLIASLLIVASRYSTAYDSVEMNLPAVSSAGVLGPRENRTPAPAMRMRCNATLL